MTDVDVGESNQTSWLVTLCLCLLVTLSGLLLNLVVIYISVFKVDKPYKWFLANLALTDFAFAALNLTGQPVFLLRPLRGDFVLLEDDFVR